MNTKMELMVEIKIRDKNEMLEPELQNRHIFPPSCSDISTLAYCLPFHPTSPQASEAEAESIKLQGCRGRGQYSVCSGMGATIGTRVVFCMRYLFSSFSLFPRPIKSLDVCSVLCARHTTLLQSMAMKSAIIQMLREFLESPSTPPPFPPLPRLFYPGDII